MKEQQLLDIISKEYNKILGHNLVGIYVHGSIAFDCFNWDKSDIDFLVVVKENIPIDIKKQLCESLNTLWEEAPPKGFEMSIVKKEFCTHFEYPTPFELHMSSGSIDWYRNNPDDFCEKMNGTDKDLAAHFTVIKSVGITLCGTPILDLFGDVPVECYIDSIKSDIENAPTEILENPMYLILNLCRVLAYLKDNLVLSKEQGAKWGLIHIPELYSHLIYQALHSYLTNVPLATIDEAEAVSYCNYMLSQIFNSGASL